MNVPAFCVDISCVGYTVYTLEIRVIYWPVWWPCPALRESGRTEEDRKGIDLGRGGKKREEVCNPPSLPSTFESTAVSMMSSLPCI